MTGLQNNSDDENNKFIHEIIKDLENFKHGLFVDMELNVEMIEKVLPMYHILIHIFTYIKFTDKEALKKLA